MKLRNRINRVLHERGLAEGEVALVARLDQGHLNRIKNGRVKPSIVTALRIADALGLPVQQLFYLEASAGPLSDPGAGRSVVAAARPPARAAGREGTKPRTVAAGSRTARHE